LTTEVTVATGADGTIDTTWSTIELASEGRGDTMGRFDTMDSTAETTGGRIPEPPGAVAEAPLSSRSDTTLLMTDTTVSTGADGIATVTCETIELRSGATTEATGRLETIDSTAEMMGLRIGSPPAVVVTAGRPTLAVAEPLGQAPSSPSPRRSQTTLFTTEVTLATGADGTTDTTCDTIALPLLAVTEATGSSETIEFTAEMIGSKIPPAAAVEEAPEARDVGQPPKTPRPSRSQTTLLTTDVTVAMGAEGATEATWDTIALASLEVMDATGNPDMMDWTAEIMGARPPAGAEVEEGALQSPRIPIPRISQTTEFTTLVTVAAGAEGTTCATSVTMALALDVTDATGRPETMD